MKKIPLCIFAVVILAACQNSDVQKISLDSVSSSSSVAVSSAIQDDMFREYRNQKFSFFYPTNWNMKDMFTSSGYVIFKSPAMEKCLTEGKCAMEGPYTDFGVSYHKDINDFLSTDDWMGKRKYENLEDFASSPPGPYGVGPVKITGKIKIDGQNAFEVSLAPFDEYAILLENNGIYVLGFSIFPFNSPEILSAKNKIISSFQFLE